MTNIANLLNLQGKVAIVTGAATGLGAATAQMLASAGANILINYMPGQEAQAQSVANGCVTESFCHAGDITQDECIRASLTRERLAGMPAAFAELGNAGSDEVQLTAFGDLKAISHVHTAANSPAMCDGAAVLLVGDQGLRDQLSITPRVEILDSVTCCAEPLEVVSGCVSATAEILRRNGLSRSDVDVFEIHEAFAATIVKLARDIGLELDSVNVNGGCIALGHPMGATGAIMVGTAIDELYRTGGELAVVAASGAAGSGSALLLRRCG